MFKIETHLHTKYSSSCGKAGVEDILPGYRDAGYSGIVVTDHFNRYCFGKLGATDWSDADKFKLFLDGYNRVKEAAPDYGLRIYRGAEIRFDECDNDYLLYNFPDELLLESDGLFTMGIAAFAPLAREAGAMIIQAHPYRRPCTPAIACYLDAVEIQNCHPRQINRNELAVEYAKDHGLLGISGSDCHQKVDIGRGGILVETLPEDETQLVQIIRSGKFEMIVP
jgi:histidinol phosphatase-like PHP family hydrolase